MKQESLQEKYSTMEIDLEEFTKDQLISLILASHELNMTFNEFIVHALEKACREFKELQKLPKVDNMGKK